MPAHDLLIVGTALAVIGATSMLGKRALVQPARSRSRWAMFAFQTMAVITLAGVIMNVGIDSDETRDGHRVTPAAVAAEPAANDKLMATDRVSAAALYQAVLTTSIADTDVPPGFQVSGREVPRSSDRLGAYSAVGAVDVVTDGPDLSDRIGFRVFLHESDAAGYFEPTSIGADFVLTDRFTWEEAGYPARCETYTYDGGGRPISATDCLARVGTVVVVGSSAIEGDGGSGNTTHAMALARAGIAHLQQIVARHAEGRPHN